MRQYKYQDHFRAVLSCFLFLTFGHFILSPACLVIYKTRSLSTMYEKMEEVLGDDVFPQEGFNFF